MGAIAVRAERLGLITPYQSKTFWMEMGRLGYRKREPNKAAAPESRPPPSDGGIPPKDISGTRCLILRNCFAQRRPRWT